MTDPKYGIPQLKKFPLPDARHVRSAIKFFNYAPPKYEKQLAAAILRRMKEYGISFDDFTVGDENRFKRYVPKTYLAHHGILGQKWGIRRYQPYPKGYTGEGRYEGPKFSLTKNVKKGHITAKGVKELSKLVSSDSARAALEKSELREGRFRKRIGIESIDDKTDLLKSGTGITRVANDEPLTDARKYVSLTESDDADDYVGHPMQLGANIGDKIYRYDYELKRDIKVAPAKEVNEYILDKYGDIQLKDLSLNPKILDEFYIAKGAKEAQKAFKDVGSIKIGEFLRESDDLDKVMRLKSYEDKFDRKSWAIERATIGRNALEHLLNDKLMQNKNSMNDVCDEFKKRGYDAIVDPEDKLINFDYPIILLNPKDTLKAKSKELIWPITEREKRIYEEHRNK